MASSRNWGPFGPGRHDQGEEGKQGLSPPPCPDLLSSQPATTPMLELLLLLLPQEPVRSYCNTVQISTKQLFSKYKRSLIHTLKQVIRLAIQTAFLAYSFYTLEVLISDIHHCILLLADE